MSVEQITEALAEFSEDYPDWEFVARRLRDAYVRDWVTCPTCNGKGDRYGVAVDGKPCPDCVDGLIPSPELRQRVKRAILESKGKWLRETDDDYQIDALRLADVVLLASRQGDTR